MRWEVACKCNGICPEDMAIVEWQKSLPPEDYDPLPPFLPDPALDWFLLVLMVALTCLEIAG